MQLKLNLAWILEIDTKHTYYNLPPPPPTTKTVSAELQVLAIGYCQRTPQDAVIGGALTRSATQIPLHILFNAQKESYQRSRINVTVFYKLSS